MSELNKIIGMRLQRCRRETGLTLEEASKKVDATLGQYSNWERGIRPVSLEYLHKLAVMYCKNGAWLAGFSEHEEKKTGQIIKINDNLMHDDLMKGDEVEIDSSITLPISTELFAISVNDKVWIRWIHTELNGSYTIKARDKTHWPDMIVKNRDELKKIHIIGRVHCIKRYI